MKEDLIDCVEVWAVVLFISLAILAVLMRWEE